MAFFFSWPIVRAVVQGGGRFPAAMFRFSFWLVLLLLLRISSFLSPRQGRGSSNSISELLLLLLLHRISWTDCLFAPARGASKKSGKRRRRGRREESFHSLSLSLYSSRSRSKLYFLHMQPIYLSLDGTSAASKRRRRRRDATAGVLLLLNFTPDPTKKDTWQMSGLSRTPGPRGNRFNWA